VAFALPRGTAASTLVGAGGGRPLRQINRIAVACLQCLRALRRATSRWPRLRAQSLPEHSHGRRCTREATWGAAVRAYLATVPPLCLPRLSMTRSVPPDVEVRRRLPRCDSGAYRRRALSPGAPSARHTGGPRRPLLSADDRGVDRLLLLTRGSSWAPPPGRARSGCVARHGPAVRPDSLPTSHPIRTEETNAKRQPKPNARAERAWPIGFLAGCFHAWELRWVG